MFAPGNSAQNTKQSQLFRFGATARQQQEENLKMAYSKELFDTWLRSNFPKGRKVEEVGTEVREDDELLGALGEELSEDDVTDDYGNDDDKNIEDNDGNDDDKNTDADGKSPYVAVEENMNKDATTNSTAATQALKDVPTIVDISSSSRDKDKVEDVNIPSDQPQTSTHPPADTPPTDHDVASAISTAAPIASATDSPISVNPVPPVSVPATPTALAPRRSPTATATSRPTLRPAPRDTLRPTTTRLTSRPTNGGYGLNEPTALDEDDDIYEGTKHQRQSSPILRYQVIVGVLVGLVAMIFTAWQMSDNPDGIFASMCRLIITCLQLVYRVLVSPCRKCIPCCFSSSHHHAGNGYHEPYGHMRVSTMDYGYKDPTIELS